MTTPQRRALFLTLFLAVALGLWFEPWSASEPSPTDGASPGVMVEDEPVHATSEANPPTEGDGGLEKSILGRASTPMGEVLVTDASAVPLEGARIEALSSDWIWLGETNASGEFSFPMRSEQRALRASMHGFEEVEVDLGSVLSDPVRITLSRRTCARGFINMADGTAPPSDVVVALWPFAGKRDRHLLASSTCRRTNCDEFGSFEFCGLDPDGTYELTAGGPGVGALEERLVLAPHEVQLDIELGYAWNAAVLVEECGGRPVRADARMHASGGWMQLRGAGQTRIDPDDVRAALMGIGTEIADRTGRDLKLWIVLTREQEAPPAELEYRVMRPGYEVAHAAGLPLPFLSTAETYDPWPICLVPLELCWGKATLRVAGLAALVPPGYEPVTPVATVKLFREDGESYEVALPDSLDELVLDPIPCGTYRARLNLEHGSYSPDEGSLVVDSATDGLLEFSVLGTSSLVVEVEGVDGSSYDGRGQLVLRSKTGGRRATVSFHGPPYVAVGLEAGEYKVQFRRTLSPQDEDQWEESPPQLAGRPGLHVARSDFELRGLMGEITLHEGEANHVLLRQP